jgi:hypothetical protein
MREAFRPTIQKEWGLDLNCREFQGPAQPIMDAGDANSSRRLEENEAPGTIPEKAMRAGGAYDG